MPETTAPLPDETSPSTATPPLRSTRKRHGARNQEKSKEFVKWLRSTFHNFDHVVDVAGGKGELAARLTLCHGASVTLIDPRVGVDIEQVYIQRVVPRLPEKWQKRLAQRQADNPAFLSNLIAQRFRHLSVYFTENTLDGDIRSVLEDCTLLIGLHADAATECIVDAALRNNIPFVVVPCCVFPNLFHTRTIFHEESGRTEVVRNHEQFCRYLLQKDPRLQVAQLPFEGRNTAIWWEG